MIPGAAAAAASTEPPAAVEPMLPPSASAHATIDSSTVKQQLLGLLQNVVTPVVSDWSKALETALKCDAVHVYLRPEVLAPFNIPGVTDTLAMSESYDGPVVPVPMLFAFIRVADAVMTQVHAQLV